MTRQCAAVCEWGALLVALMGSAGSVFLSVGMGLNACPLCFYQRTFVLSTFAVLVVARLVGSRLASGLPCLLVTPLVFGGLGTAIYHVGLELGGTLECPDGLFALGSAPAQSLAVFILLALLVVTRASSAGETRSGLKVLVAIGLGLALSALSVVSAPPLPAAKVRPSKAEGYVLKGCEPAPVKEAPQGPASK